MESEVPWKQKFKLFPAPKTKTEIRRLIGMIGYYSRYIKDYAKIVEPLANALRGKNKTEQITWTPECQKAFDTIKGKLVERPVLHAPDYSKQFIIQVNSSNTGTGVVLCQRDEKAEEHPILYLSRKFIKAELNYCTAEKVCLDIIYAIKKLRHYLDGQPFKIETDHNTLVWLQSNVGATPSGDEKPASDPPAIPRNLCRTCLHQRADLACRKNPEKPLRTHLQSGGGNCVTPAGTHRSPASVIYASIP
ncbi:Retrovirus-related Pol polyprotein from transposon 297 [Araneus ventricosus]|uniref:RNA-directed DNA polymerase n=1 Tax=Araneus ventricosus TaxID=182803 RepID=A0A4Y2WT91_ARAVE|nr:Retrovirus-related Pol polyprotein from transposon 297 [Araneus ventricosus]